MKLVDNLGPMKNLFSFLGLTLKTTTRSGF